MNCIFCVAAVETRDHIFFECTVASSLWSALFSLNGLQFKHHSWDAFFDLAAACWKGKSPLTTIMKIASNALIYTIWKERNKRLFQSQSSTVAEMFIAIKELIADKKEDPKERARLGLHSKQNRKGRHFFSIALNA
ncbi:uncharacterized protein LOC120199456 [Hibiscus syriacus]|uniref:uncharacterized protein LOC120199456 n=1 Tax=Hibiscus syriacus TaxID=106335 RepID=UPI001921D108|nr:uncharacterized protein LOC120199456 [Hibiscus syriacus]